jgi:hypothetical protein
MTDIEIATLPADMVPSGSVFLCPQAQVQYGMTQ